MRTPFTGVGTALVTPFTRSGELDEAAVRRLGRRQIDAGVHFLCPCGTTGENPTLTDAERLRTVEILVEEANGKVPILAGAGGYDTKEVIHIAREMARRGASGFLSVTPYYNKPTQEGLYQHYRAFVESNPQPVKAAMAAMGLLEEVFRLPMVSPRPESKEKINKVLKALGLLKGALV